MKDSISLFRKRLIPAENVLLKDDVLVEINDRYLFTTWHTLHPKKNLHHGQSLWLLDKGIKISRFCREDDSLICWYCDVVSYEWDETRTVLTATDLLADIQINANGALRVLDLDELAEALDKELITPEQLSLALKQANDLLNDIYSGRFERYEAIFKEHGFC